MKQYAQKRWRKQYKDNKRWYINIILYYVYKQKTV
jgi:hypothetical protein